MSTPATEGADRDAYPLWIEERIRNPDTDQFGHVNNAAIASYCEAGRIALFDDPMVEEAMSGRHIVVASLTIHFERELFYPGMVRIGTAVASVGSSSFRVVQALHGAPGRFASSEAACVALDAATRRPAPLPASVRDLLLERYGRRAAR